MKKNLKEKAIAFWRKHKFGIITVTTMVGITLVSILASKDEEQEQIPENEPERLSEIEEPRETVDIPEEPAKEPEVKETMPCGAEVVEDDLKYGTRVSEDEVDDLPEIVVNDVPLALMGEFGQELADRCRNAGMEERGWDNMDEAMASMIICIQSNTYHPEELAEEEKEETAA